MILKTYILTWEMPTVMNEYVESTKYYGENVAYGNPKGQEDIMKQLQQLSMLFDEEEDQYEDEDEMSQWYEFDAYQDFTDETAIYPPEKGLEYVALGLASEAGEFAGKVKKMIRDNKYDLEAMAAELGDVLWYVARAAAELDLHLSDIAQENVEKLKSRMERGKLKGSGDDR